MKSLNWFARRFVLAGAAITMFATASAQDTSTTTIRHGQPAIETSVRNAEVVYVEGNDLVLKLENGKIEHLNVPSSDKFRIDGREVGVQGLRPGTRLTQTITTTTTPRYVNTVRVIKGKVWQVISPTSVIVSLPDGKNQIFRIPADAKFSANGHARGAHELRKGMTFEATVVTDEQHTVISQNKTNTGEGPAPALPKVVGFLVFQHSLPEVAMATPPVATVTAEHAWARLPQTASSLPLIGLGGLVLLGAGLGLRTARAKGSL